MSVEIELAEDLEHALSLLQDGDPQVRPVSGATDLVLRIHSGRLNARRLVSIADLPELSFVRADAQTVRLGGGTTVSEVLAHPELTAEFPALAAAAREFASPQIRNRATLAGNIGNASPAADLVPPLIALGASVTLRSKAASRQVPLESLFLGMGKTGIAPAELVTELTLPRRKRAFQAFSKFGSRSANIISVVNAALCLELNADRRITDARVAYGCVAPRPLRAVKVENALKGKTLDQKLVDEIEAVVRAEATPIDDVRGSRRYKLRLVVGATQDALLRALVEASA